jgi:hypothetical protein
MTRLPDYQLSPSQWDAGGQSHPQGVSQLRLHRQTQLKAKPQTRLPPAHPYPLPANVCQASPFRFAKG